MKPPDALGLCIGEVEERWKTLKSLPPLRIPVFIGIPSDLMEVEEKSQKKIQRERMTYSSS